MKQTLLIVLASWLTATLVCMFFDFGFWKGVILGCLVVNAGFSALRVARDRRERQ